MDKGNAVTAAAHTVARLIYAMLIKGEEYTDAEQNYLEKRDRERMLRTPSLGATKLGMQIVPIAQPA